MCKLIHSITVHSVISVTITRTCRTELQKLRACVDLLSSGTVTSMTGIGDCQSSTTISLELGNSE